MPLTHNNIAFITSAEGQAHIQTLQYADLSPKHTLKHITNLRKQLNPEQAAAVLLQAQLRQKAIAKFGDAAAKMLFTEAGIQQASDPLVRHYRAQAMNAQAILDCCCGIGSDAITMAQNNANVLGLDIDDGRIQLATYNAQVAQSSAQFTVADVTQPLPSGYDTIFFDPARRNANGKRIYHVERYLPPLSTIKQWQASQIVVKLSPGVDLAQLADYDGMLEFISVHGELKEAVLWLNQNKFVSKATLLTDEGAHHFVRQIAPEVTIAAPQGWLVEPDPAIIRAGLVQDLAQQFNGYMLDETIAYFTITAKPQSVWARSWQILDWMPFNLKKLKAYLRERNISRITVKKRGSPITPEELTQKLKLKHGDANATLVLTRFKGQHIVLICEDFIP